MLTLLFSTVMFSTNLHFLIVNPPLLMVVLPVVTEPVVTTSLVMTVFAVTRANGNVVVADRNVANIGFFRNRQLFRRHRVRCYRLKILEVLRQLDVKTAAGRVINDDMMLPSVNLLASEIPPLRSKTSSLPRLMTSRYRC